MEEASNIPGLRFEPNPEYKKGHQPPIIFDPGALAPKDRCPSANSPSGLHCFGRYVRGVPVATTEATISCKFCGEAEPPDAAEEMGKALARAEPSAPAAKIDPAITATINRPREEFETAVSRRQAASVGEQLTGRKCWTVKRRVGRVKICVLHVDRGESERSLIFEGSDWWICLRALHAFFKNRGELEAHEEDEGGEVVTT